MVVNADGTFTYTPGAELAASGGEDTFTVRVADTGRHLHGLFGFLRPGGGHSATREITVVVAPVAVDPANQAPIVGDAPYQYTVDPTTGVVRGTVSVTDPDGDPLSYRIENALDPEVGILAINATTGQWAFRPSPQARFDSWVSGGEVVQSFSIVASDGRDAVTITVEAPVEPAATLQTEVADGVGAALAGVAVGRDGRVYAVSSGDGSVKVINPDGSLGGPIAVGGSLFGVTVGADGRIYVTDAASGAISAIDPADDYSVQQFATVAGAGAVASDAAGRLYVTSIATNSLTVLSADGSVADTVSLDGIATGVAVGADGRVYASVLNQSVMGSTVVVIDPDGTTDSIDTGTVIVYGVAIDAHGRMYFSDIGGGLTIVDPDGTSERLVLSATPLPGVAVGPDGRIYVTDVSGDVKVLRFVPVEESAPEYTVDDVTGVVTGALDVLDPGGFAYALGSPLDPSVGTVEVDPDTGAWTFVPTALARRAAAADPQAGTVSFSIVVTGGEAPVTVLITAPVDADSSPEAAAPPFTIIGVDADTGVVTGRVEVEDIDGDRLTYLVVSGVEPNTGRVVMDTATGVFTFTPTALARHHAWFTPTDDQASFTVIVTDGSSDATVVVSVPIAAQHPDADGTLDAAELEALADIGDILLSQSADGTVRSINGSFTSTRVMTSADASEVLNGIAELLGAPAEFADEADITVRSVVQASDEVGQVATVYYRLRPSLNGVPVLGSEVVLVTNGDGQVTGVFSYYDNRSESIDTTPATGFDTGSVAESIAFDALVTTLDLDDDAVASLLSSLAIRSDLVVYALDPEGVAPQLAWRVWMVTSSPLDGSEPTSPVESNVPLVSSTYYIHANGPDAGGIIHEYHGFEGAYVLDGDLGTDLNGQERVLVVERDGDSYRLVDTIRGITTHKADDSKSWGSVVYRGFFGWDPSAVSAHYHTAQAVDFYRFDLGLDSFSRNGAPLNVLVVPTLSSIAGFGFNDRDEPFLVFGYDSEAALDTVGHELTHAAISYITNSPEGFGSRREAAALDEAYSDIIGSLIEASRARDGKSDVELFTVGEDIGQLSQLIGSGSGKCGTSGTCGLRYLADPSQFNNAENTYREHYSDIDWATDSAYEVSTVFSLAAARMLKDSRTADISYQEWARVFYDSIELSSGAGMTFARARTNVVSAAINRGLTREHIQAIEDAFASVGIDAEYRTPANSAAAFAPPLEGVTLPGTPDGLIGGDDFVVGALTEDGSRALLAATYRPVAGFNTDSTTRVALIDTTTGTQIGETFVIAGSGTAAFNPQGTRAIVISSTTDPISGGYETTRIAVIDTSTGQQVGRTATLSGDYASALEFNNSGTVAIIALTDNDNVGNDDVTEVVLIDVTSGKTIGSRFEMAGQIESMTLDASGTRAVVRTRIRPDVSGVAILNRVAVVDTATGRQVGATIDLPGESELLFNADGSRVLVVTPWNFRGAENPTTEIRVINTATGTQVGSTLSVTGFTVRTTSVNSVTQRAVVVVDEATSGSVVARVVVVDVATGQQVGSTHVISDAFMQHMEINDAGTRAILVAATVEYFGDGGASWIDGGTVVSLIDTATGASLGTVATIPDGYFVGMQRNSDDSVIVIQTYDPSEETGRITVINANGVQLLQTDPEQNARVLAINDIGTRVVIATVKNNGVEVGVFDTITREWIGTPRLVPTGASLADARIDADQNRLIVTLRDNRGGIAMTVFAVDLATGGLVGSPVTIAGNSSEPAKLVGNSRAILAAELYTGGPTGETYTTEVALVDTTTGTQVGTTYRLPGALAGISASSDVDAVQVTPDGSRAMVLTSRVLQTGESALQVTDVYLFDTASGVQIGTVITLRGSLSRPVEFDVAGEHAVITAVFRDDTMDVPRTHAVVINALTGETANGANA